MSGKGLTVTPKLLQSMNALVELAISFKGIAACIAIIGGWNKNPINSPATIGIPSWPARLVFSSSRKSKPNPKQVPARPIHIKGRGVE